MNVALPLPSVVTFVEPIQDWPSPKPDWSGLFAPGAEIQRYLRDVVDDYGLDGRIRLNTEVTSATFSGSGPSCHGPYDQPSGMDAVMGPPVLD